MMDLNMPIMDGLEATKKIKAYFSESGIFISDMNFDQDPESSIMNSEESSEVAVA